MYMKEEKILLYSLIPFFLLLVSCADTGKPQVDLINDTFPEAQAELREALNAIVRDNETANTEGLRASHLLSEKFSKFGPRSFERVNVESTNEEEAAHFSLSKISNRKIKI